MLVAIGLDAIGLLGKTSPGAWRDRQRLIFARVRSLCRAPRELNKQAG